jgi:hypothetical protein
MDAGKPRRRSEDFLEVPPPRLFSVKQMAGILGLIALLQTLGGKFIIDSYIDARIKTHDRDPAAHAGIMAAKAETQKDGEEVRRQFQTLNEKLDATNQRLARIEGSLITIKR